MWLKFYNFEKNLETVEALLYELASLEDELRYLGLRSALRKINLEKVRPALDEFSERLADCTRIAPLINKDLSTQLNSLLNETKIEGLITQLAVRLKLAEIERQKPLRQGLATYAYILGKMLAKSTSIKLFSDDSIRLENVLASLSRLKTIMKLLTAESQHRTSNDDEIFKPSNVDVNIIITQIDLAIENIDTAYNLSRSEKERLIIYLKEAKAEVVSDTPSWKKVIGALIICATLLSGVADAPQAIQNLNTAIKHILGTSIERALPILLPARPMENDLDKNSVEDIQIT